jgi:hypothetical protein
MESPLKSPTEKFPKLVNPVFWVARMCVLNPSRCVAEQGVIAKAGIAVKANKQSNATHLRMRGDGITGSVEMLNMGPLLMLVEADLRWLLANGMETTLGDIAKYTRLNRLNVKKISAFFSKNK